MSQQFRCRYPDSHIANARGNSASGQADRLRLVLNYLRAHACVDCGERDPVVLDVDQRDARCKAVPLGRLVWRGTAACLATELTRRDVRCANCQHRRTAIQRNWHKLALAIIEGAGAAGLEPATSDFGDRRSTS
jgi:hypothetical protein